MAVQKLLIRYLLDPLAKIISRVPRKVKDAGFVVSFLCIIFLYIGQGGALFNFRYMYFFALGCLGLGGMIVCTLPSQVKAVSFRKSLLFIWLGIGGLMLLSSILYNLDYLPEALLFLVVYPVIFIVWNQGNTNNIFKQLFRGIEISFWIYALACMLFYPVNDVRYSGVFINVNGTAGYLALVSVCLLIDYFWFEKKFANQIRKLIAFGICAAMLLYTGSRTGILELTIVAVALVVISLRRFYKSRKLQFLKSALLVAASVILFFNSTMYVMQFGYSAKTEVVNFVHNIFGGTPNGGGSDSGSNKPVRPEDSANLIGDRLDTDGRDLGQISTGRLQIWEGYVKQLNLFGHPDSGTVTFMDGEIEKTYHTTHMTVLQIAYENGVIAGVLYLCFNLTAGICSLLYAVRRKDDPCACIPLLISLAYGVLSLLANTGVSFWYLGTLMYYLVQFPIMVKPQDAPEPAKTDAP